ncbi:MAG: dockerin type I domain-containing protein [Planctomycetota bacterium]
MDTRMTSAAVVLIAASTAAAQFAITSSTIDGGGGTLAGSTYTLSGTVGQPDAGGTLVGSTYELTGGFWPGAVAPPSVCFGDINGDGSTNLADFTILAMNFGTAMGAVLGDGDLNNDGAVNLADFTLLAMDFGCAP